MHQVGRPADRHPVARHRCCTDGIEAGSVWNCVPEDQPRSGRVCLAKHERCRQYACEGSGGDWLDDAGDIVYTALRLRAGEGVSAWDEYGAGSQVVALATNEHHVPRIGSTDKDDGKGCQGEGGCEGHRLDS